MCSVSSTVCVFAAKLWSVPHCERTCAQNACNTVEYCVYMRQRDPTQAVGLNIMFDSVLINACFISSWSWTSFQTTGDPLSNCCEALRQIRLVSPPSMCTFFFSLTITQSLSWPIFQCGICFLYLLSDLIFCSKCKLPPLPSSWV